MLTRGSKGQEVSELQQLLAAANFPPGEADGEFGDRTVTAVVALQQCLGLVADGVVGPVTMAAAHEAAKAGSTLVLLHGNPFDPRQRHLAPCVPDITQDA